MATYISDDPKLLDELFRKDGEGQLLVGYETGKEKPHAEEAYFIAYMLNSTGCESVTGKRRIATQAQIDKYLKKSERGMKMP